MQIPELSPLVSNVILLLVISGAVQLAKTWMAPEHAPIVAPIIGLVLGVLLGVAGSHAAQSLIVDGVVGLALGFGASGVYVIAGKVGGTSGSTTLEAARLGRRARR